MVQRQSLRRRCSRLLNDIGVGIDGARPPTIADICERLAVIRGRPVDLVPVVTAPGSPTGMWIATPAADYIFHLHVRQTSPVHVAGCILHEIGHIVLGHSGTTQFRGHLDTVRRTLAREAASEVMLRHHHDSVEEREAETFAIVAVGYLGEVRAATTVARDEDTQLYARLRSFLPDATTADGA